MEEFLADIRMELPAEQSKEVYATLAKVLRNIVRNPSESKFRTLKKDNQLVAENICISMAAVSFLLLIGFEDCDSHYHCPFSTDLEQIRFASVLLEHMTMSLDFLTKPGPASTSAKAMPIVSRNAPRTRDAQRPEDKQNDQLQALRASQQARHAESTSSHRVADGSQTREAPSTLDLLTGAEENDARPPPSDLLTGDPEPLEIDFFPGNLQGQGPQVFDLSLQDCEEQDLASRLEADPSVEGRRQAPRTLRDFQKRESKGQNQETGAEELRSLRQAQQQKFKEFQQDPNARKSAEYLRPPSSCYAEKNKDPSSTAKQQTNSWLSEVSERFSSGLADTSKQLSEGLKETSGRVSASLSEVTGRLSISGLGTWMPPSCSAPSTDSCSVGPLPGRFRVIVRSGADVWKDVEKDGPPVGMLNFGEEVVGLELWTDFEGTPHIRIESPLCGWLEVKPGVIHRVAEEVAEFG